MTDEHFYAAALREYESGNSDEGLRAKALVAAGGVDERTKVEYIKLRVDQLKGRSTTPSLRNWYASTSNGQRLMIMFLSTILLFAYGLGLIPLAMMIWLALGERADLAERLERERMAKADSAPSMRTDPRLRP